MAIDTSQSTPLANAVGVWLWQNHSKDFIRWLGSTTTKQSGDKASPKLERWQKFQGWQKAADQYRQEMLRQYNIMRIIGMPELTILEGIFTDAYLLDKPKAWQRHSIEELEKGIDAGETGREQRWNAISLLQQKNRLFILGKPGAGKTTFLKYLTVQATQNQIDKVPIFISLREWSDDTETLMTYMVKQFRICRFPESETESFIEYLLSNGKALVLFDGLDEVNGENGKRHQIIRNIKDFAKNYSKVQCVVTCRIAAAEYEFEHFSYVEMADFSPEQAKMFVQKWFRNDLIKREKFVEAFDKYDNKGIRDLARTPLLLTLLCIAFDETMVFPVRKVEIYEEAIEALFKKWDSSRSIQRDEVYRQLSPTRKRQMLSHIANEIFKEGQIFIRRDDLIKKIEAFLHTLPPDSGEKPSDGYIVLRAIEAQHGLLIERATGVYSFSHLTFHEYFVAKYISNNPRLFQGLALHAADSRWREVLMMTASLLDTENANIFFDEFYDIWQMRLSTYKSLVAILNWANRKAATTEGIEATLVRIVYIVNIFSLPVSNDLKRELSTTRRLLHATDLINALSIYRIRYIADKQGFGIDPQMFRAYDQNLATKLGQDLGFTVYGMGTLASDVARGLALSFALRLSSDLLNKTNTSEVLIDVSCLFLLRIIEVISQHKKRGKLLARSPLAHRFTEIVSTLPSNERWIDLRLALINIRLPDSHADDSEWCNIVSNLRQLLIRYRDIGHPWTLSTEDTNRLNSYLAANVRLLECLNLASVSDRDAIKSRLLLPPTTTDTLIQ